MINLSLVNVSMQLINVVPDNIIDWVGGRISGSLGKGGEDMVGGAAKGALAGAGWFPLQGGKNGNKGVDKESKQVDGHIPASTISGARPK